MNRTHFSAKQHAKSCGNSIGCFVKSEKALCPWKAKYWMSQRRPRRGWWHGRNKVGKCWATYRVLQAKEQT